MLSLIGGKIAALVGGGTLKWILVGLAALAIVGAITGGVAYVRGLTKELADEHAARVSAEAREAGLRQEWAALVAEQKRAAALLEEAERRKDAAEAAASHARAVLSEHDLGKLAHAKPGLLERRVNRAADRTNCLLERASGADRDCDGEAGAGGAAPTSAGAPGADAVARPPGR